MEERTQRNDPESEKLTMSSMTPKKKSRQNDFNNGFDDVDCLFPVPNFGIDVGDIPMSKASVSTYDIFCICFSILTHIIDIFADLNLARSYYTEQKQTFFFWTLAFLFIPSFINIIVSIRMYNQDKEARPEVAKTASIASKVIKNVVCWPAILVLQLAPVLRYFDCLTYAIKSHNAKRRGEHSKQKKYYLKMLKEEQDIALLRVFECFLEAAPHLILQITIMIIAHDEQNLNLHFVHQCISIISSLAGMGWAMASYHRSIRLAQWDKENISVTGNVIQFCWHFFITVSRIMAISAAATVFTLSTAVAAVIHWLIMTIWIMTKPAGIKQFCRDQSKPPHSRLSFLENIKSFMFASVLGVVFIFTYLKPTEGPTYWRHIFYYIVCGLENLAACLIWAFIDKTSYKWYYEIVITICIAPTVLGVSFMIAYYQFFHPTTKKISVNRESVAQPV